MHDDEVDVDEALVRRLVAAQFPHWADLAIDRVDSTGTVNAIFRLGADLAVRLPRTPRWHDLAIEMCWLGSLAPLLPIPVPVAVAVGEPGQGYAWPWAVFRWIEGSAWALENVDDQHAAAEELADFVRSLQRLDPMQVPCPPPDMLPTLASSDAGVRDAIAAARGMLDTDAVLEAWEAAVRVPEWRGAAVLLHGDLMAGNVVVREGRIAAVIDWAAVRAGDPARDLVPAWTLFAGGSRRTFRAATSFDDDTWQRARGWALTRIANVAYYATTNPRFSADAVATIAAALSDPWATGHAG